jgi:ATP-dependent Clp protease ATP-binding subunit ClpB
VLQRHLWTLQGLDRQQIGTIVRLQAKRVADRLASRKIKLELDDSAVEWLADKVHLV